MKRNPGLFKWIIFDLNLDNDFFKRELSFHVS